MLLIQLPFCYILNSVYIQECMKINVNRIKAWVDKELREKRYGVLEEYNGHSKEDIVNC